MEQRRIAAGAAGRMKGTQMQKQKKFLLLSHYRELAKNDVLNTTDRDFFFAGLGLYAGEGFKYGSRAGFSNSNSSIIIFIMKWFREVCKVSENAFFLSAWNQ